MKTIANTSITPSQIATEQIRREAQRREDAMVKLSSLGFRGRAIADELNVPISNVYAVLQRRHDEILDVPLEKETFHYLVIELSVLCRRTLPEILSVMKRTGRYPPNFFTPASCS
jgi:hypothetical protein